jgi:hypothetical protein
LGIYGSTTSTPNKAFFYAGGTTSSLGFFVNGTEKLTLLQNGKVGIGTTTPAKALAVVGDISTTGCLYYASSSLGSCASDERIKKDVHAFDLGLDVLLGINPVQFKYNGLAGFKNDGQEQLGVIAQNIEKVAPRLIKTKMVQLHEDDRDKTEIKIVDYGAFTYVIINALKEFYHKWFDDSVAIHREIASKDKEIMELKIKAKKAEQENKAIRAYLCSKDPMSIICN